MEQTERMMIHSLEGQAIELAWIRDKAVRSAGVRLHADVPAEDLVVFLLSTPCAWARW